MILWLHIRGILQHSLMIWPYPLKYYGLGLFYLTILFVYIIYQLYFIKKLKTLIILHYTNRTNEPAILDGNSNPVADYFGFYRLWSYS